MPPYLPSSKLVRALLTTQDRDLGGPGERGTEIKVQKLSDLQPMKCLTVKPRGPGSQRRLKTISQWSSPFAEPSGLILSSVFAFSFPFPLPISLFTLSYDLFPCRPTAGVQWGRRDSFPQLSLPLLGLKA